MILVAAIAGNARNLSLSAEGVGAGASGFQNDRASNSVVARKQTSRQRVAWKGRGEHARVGGAHILDIHGGCATYPETRRGRPARYSESWHYDLITRLSFDLHRKVVWMMSKPQARSPEVYCTSSSMVMS